MAGDLDRGAGLFRGDNLMAWHNAVVSGAR